MDEDDWSPFDRVQIEHLWVDQYGCRWCSFFVDGVPWLSSEEDA